MNVMYSHHPGRCMNTNTRGNASGAFMETKKANTSGVPGISLCRIAALSDAIVHQSNHTASAIWARGKTYLSFIRMQLYS